MSHFDAAWALTTGMWLGVSYCWYRYGKAKGYSDCLDTLRRIDAQIRRGGQA
jgi:hypothetical protein